MLDFLERHQILFLFILPVLIFAGAAVNVSAIVIAAVAIGYFFRKDRHDSIIVFFVMVLLLGDSRLMEIQFIKGIRVEVMVLMFAISIYELRNNYYRVNMLMLYYLPFLGVALLALIFSPLQELALEKTISFSIFYFVLFNYVHHKFERYGAQLMIDVLYLIVSILSLGFILLPLFPDYLTYGGQRYNGIMGNPNGMGMLVTLTVPLATYVFMRNKELPKRFKVMTWVLIMTSLLLCSSRNSIFSIALFAILLIGLRGGTFRRIIFIFVFLPATAIFFRFVDLETLFTSLGLERYFRVSELESGSGRIFAWSHALELIQRQPLIGCGFACEEYHFVHRTTFRLWMTGHQGGVHNSYLAYAINTGIAGTIFYLGFLFNAARKVRNLKFLVPFMAAVLFSAIFESWLFSSLSAFHILFLLQLVFLIVDTNREELLVSNLAGDFSHEAAKGVLK
ncbi:MAG: O-antigen ligase family protein [Bacteroidia bacterium]